MTETLVNNAAGALATESVGEVMAEPLMDAAEQAEAARREEHVQKLLARLSQNPDFPSLRDSIRSIQKLARAENAHLKAFTEEILSDVALSNKLLRLINTAFYSSVGGGSIDNLSRAISLMGFQSVGMLAASLKLFDNLPKGPSASRVQQEFSRALMAGLLANEICPSYRLAQSTYLTALFQNLGRMLVWMHFPEEASRIESMTRQHLEHSSPEDLAVHGRHALQVLYDNRHAKSILYLSFDDLSCEVARLWGWPDKLQIALRPYLPDNLEQDFSTEEYVRVACSLSNHLAVLLAETHPEDRECEFASFQNRWSKIYGESPEDFANMLERVDAQWSQMAQVMNLAKLSPLLEKNLSQLQSAMKRNEPLPAAFMLTSVLQRPSESGAVPILKKTAGSQGTPNKGTVAVPQLGAQPEGLAGKASTRASSTIKGPANSQLPDIASEAVMSADQAEASLSRHIDELSECVVGDTSLSEILTLTAKIFMDSLHAQRVIIALKDERSSNLLGRIGMGDRGPLISQWFDIPMSPPTDLFGLLCAKHADTLVVDSSDQAIAGRLPAWYLNQVNAPTFLILPFSRDGLGTGMIYADRAMPHSLQISNHLLQRLKTLRNQVTMAMYTRRL